MLLGIVDAAVAGLEEEERQNRRRERELAALLPEMMLFDASAEGEWVRREQGKATRSILRITERFRKARRRGEALSADPPKPPRLGPTPLPPLEIRPVVGPQERMDDPYRRPGRDGWIPPLVILDDPSRRQPREYIGGRAAGRRKEIKNQHKYKGRRCSPERAERIAIRGIQWLAELGLALLIIASLGTIAGAPASDRPEDSARSAQPVILDAPDHPSPGHPGPECAFLPLNRPSPPRNEQNEPKDGGFVRILRPGPFRVIHAFDLSRGPPAARGDPSSTARPFSEPPPVRASEPLRADGGDDPAGVSGCYRFKKPRLSTRSSRDSGRIRSQAVI